MKPNDTKHWLRRKCHKSPTSVPLSCAKPRPISKLKMILKSRSTCLKQRKWRRSWKLSWTHCAVKIQHCQRRLTQWWRARYARRNLNQGMCFFIFRFEFSINKVMLWNHSQSGERIPSKLKCTHIVCHQCAQGWLQAMGTKASCPQCRTVYRQGDIKPVNLNCEL